MLLFGIGLFDNVGKFCRKMFHFTCDDVEYQFDSFILAEGNNQPNGLNIYAQA